jgi:hypothetical protein
MAILCRSGHPNSTATGTVETRGIRNGSGLVRGHMSLRLARRKIRYPMRVGAAPCLTATKSCNLIGWFLFSTETA